MFRGWIQTEKCLDQECIRPGCRWLWIIGRPQCSSRPLKNITSRTLLIFLYSPNDHYTLWQHFIIHCLKFCKMCLKYIIVNDTFHQALHITEFFTFITSWLFLGSHFSFEFWRIKTAPFQLCRCLFIPGSFGVTWCLQINRDHQIAQEKKKQNWTGLQKVLGSVKRRHWLLLPWECLK